METPSFTFRLERVRSLREQAEDQAREQLARELSLRLRGEAMLRAAVERASDARAQALATAGRTGASGADLLASQAWIEQAERTQQSAALDLDRRDAEVSARREALAHASRDRQAIDKLAERQKADHRLTWERRAQGALDELALAVHRRGSVMS